MEVRGAMMLNQKVQYKDRAARAHTHTRTNNTHGRGGAERKRRGGRSLLLGTSSRSRAHPCGTNQEKGEPLGSPSMKFLRGTFGSIVVKPCRRKNPIRTVSPSCHRGQRSTCTTDTTSANTTQLSVVRESHFSPVTGKAAFQLRLPGALSSPSPGGALDAPLEGRGGGGADEGTPAVPGALRKASGAETGTLGSILGGPRQTKPSPLGEVGLIREGEEGLPPPPGQQEKGGLDDCRVGPSSHHFSRKAAFSTSACAG